MDTFPLCFFFFLVDCLDPTCSSHGVCVNGECLCSPGWGGLNCELARVQCPDQCSGHGTYLPDTGLCSCDPNWMGPDCSVGKPRGFILSFLSTHALCSFCEPKQMGICSFYLAWERGNLVSGIAPLLISSQSWSLRSLRNKQKSTTRVLVPLGFITTNGWGVQKGWVQSPCIIDSSCTLPKGTRKQNRTIQSQANWMEHPIKQKRGSLGVLGKHVIKLCSIPVAGK